MPTDTSNDTASERFAYSSKRHLEQLVEQALAVNAMTDTEATEALTVSRGHVTRTEWTTHLMNIAERIDRADGAVLQAIHEAERYTPHLGTSTGRPRCWYDDPTLTARINEGVRRGWCTRISRTQLFWTELGLEHWRAHGCIGVEVRDEYYNDSECPWTVRVLPATHLDDVRRVARYADVTDAERFADVLRFELRKDTNR